MVLGYEQPVDIPVMSIYDKDMMKMYLNALREDYNQGVKEQEEFNKLAADFTSPIGKDNQRWYDITTKPIVDFLNQNPDAIRSVEGRSRIRQFINSRPYGEMANLRQSAANAKLFDAARQKMIADGTYSGDMAKFFNEDFSNWSTADNGVWGKVAPTKYIGMEDALLPTIQMLQKSYRPDEEASKKHPGYTVFNVSEQQAREAINRNYVDLMQMPSMQYHLAKSGLTEEQFKDLLTRQALSQTPEKLEANQWQLNEQRFKFEADQAEKERALKRDLANKDRALKRELAKGGNDQQQDVQFTDRVEFNTQTAEMPSNMAGAFVNYFKRMSNATKDAKAKQKYAQYIKEWTQYAADPSKGNGFLKKYGYMDKDGNLTQKYYNWKDKVIGPFREKNVQSRAETIKNSQELYNNRLIRVSGPNEPEIIQQDIAGTSKRQKNGYYQAVFGNGLRYQTARALDFGGGTTKSSVNRQNSVHFVFDDWLTSGKVRGNMFDTGGIKAGKFPGNVYEVSGIGVSVTKEKFDQFLNKIKNDKSRVKLSSGKLAKNATDAEIASDLGVRYINANGSDRSWTDITKNGQNTNNRKYSGKQEAEYILIPTSYSKNAVGMNMTGLNNADKIQMVGKGGAKETYPDSYKQAIIFGE